MERQIGICLGLGLSSEATALHLDIVTNTIRNHIAKNGAFIATVRAETEAAAAKCFAKKVQKLEDRADSRLSLAETKNQIRKEVYDKLLARLQDEDTLTDDVLAKIARIGLEFTDEKPAQITKRISEHTEYKEIGPETQERLDKMLALAEQGYLRPQQALPAPEIVEAIVVSE